MDGEDGAEEVEEPIEAEDEESIETGDEVAETNMDVIGVVEAVDVESDGDELKLGSHGTRDC